jgi:hypothetical protein
MCGRARAFYNIEVRAGLARLLDPPVRRELRARMKFSMSKKKY